MAFFKNLFTKKKKTHYEHLQKKWTVHHATLQKSLWEKHKEALSWISTNTKQLTAGSLGGLILLATPYVPPALPSPDQLLLGKKQVFAEIGRSNFLISDLAGMLPKEMRPLTDQEEKSVSDLFTERFGIKVSAELENKRLNRSYGIIGQEQHLARYPGDNMSSHFNSEDSAREYWSYGMAPGLGAWGHFSRSQSEFGDKDNEREKYYIAVQTFLATDFNQRFAEYRDFFKFRKMLVVNPENGKAVVADIADAGPSVWTGKHLGGSPEVMRYLEREDGSRRGPVLYFFVDDPLDQVSLGPISVK